MIRTLKALRVLALPDLQLNPADVDALHAALQNLIDFSYEQVVFCTALYNSMCCALSCVTKVSHGLC